MCAQMLDALRLLEVFRNRGELPAEAFLGELRKQRRNHGSSSAETVLEM